MNEPNCARCGERFLSEDLRLQVDGEHDRHYVFCPHEHWRNFGAAWEQHKKERA